MMPLESEPQSDYVHKFQVAILDNSALTDDLIDDEAKIYLDWALAVAEKVATSVQDDADAEEKRDTLMKLLRVMSRLVTHRQEEDNEWFLSMLENLSTLQTSLINTGLTDQHRQRVTSLYDSDNATLLQHLTTLLLEPPESPVEAEATPNENIIQTPLGKIKTYQPPPDIGIQSNPAPENDIQPRPPKPDNGQSDY
jgi:hypothetical protein